MAGLIFLFSNPATMPGRIGLGSARREARAHGFGLYPEITEAVDPFDPTTVVLVDPMIVELINPNSPWTVIDSLENTMSRSFQDVPSGVGSGTVEIMNTDPQLALLNEELALRFRIRGRYAAQMLIEVLTRTTRHQEEEARQSTVITGRSIAAILEEAVVFPGRGPATLPIEDTRIFNFANVDFDDSGWGPCSVLDFQGTSQLFNWGGLPARWPAPMAAWIWAPGSTQTLAPAGTCYFRKWFTIPPGVNQITLFLAVDDDGELWFDGQQVIEMTGFLEYQSVTIPVTPGTHLLGVKAGNDPRYLTLLGGGDPGDAQYTIVSGDTLWGIAAKHYGDPLRWGAIYASNKTLIDAEAIAHGKDPNFPGPGWWIFPGDTITLPGIPGPGSTPTYFNPAGLLVAVYESTSNGLGALLNVTNNTWRCLPYPANAPGMTPGEVMNHLISEAKARGCFPQFQTTFNSFVDSAGSPWTKLGDISTRVGDDYLTVLTQLAETYIDFSMKPAGLVLDAYNIDTDQHGSTASYTEEYDITSLINTRSA